MYIFEFIFTRGKQIGFKFNQMYFTIPLGLLFCHKRLISATVRVLFTCLCVH